MATIENLSLNDGNTIPQLGLGTYKMDDQQARESVRYALEVGYRHVDTASFYANEEGVGQGIADAIAAGTLTREELFVTTKVWNDARVPGRHPGVSGAIAAQARRGLSRSGVSALAGGRAGSFWGVFRHLARAQARWPHPFGGGRQFLSGSSRPAL